MDLHRKTEGEEMMNAETVLLQTSQHIRSEVLSWMNKMSYQSIQPAYPFRNVVIAEHDVVRRGEVGQI